MVGKLRISLMRNSRLQLVAVLKMGNKIPNVVIQPLNVFAFLLAGLMFAGYVTIAFHLNHVTSHSKLNGGYAVSWFTCTSGAHGSGAKEHLTQHDNVEQ